MFLSTIVQQILLRSGAIAIVKLLGAIGRIPLYRLLGAEGIGLYQMAYSYYGLLITILTGGFSAAVSLATAKDMKTGRKMFHLSLVILTLAGTCIAVLSYWCSSTIADLIGDNQLIRPLQYLAPAFLFVPILSIIRGYLQGLEYYSHVAISEMIEQIIRVLGMVALASFLLQRGLSEAVGGAVFGAVLGSLAAFLFLLVPLLSLTKQSILPQKFNATPEFHFFFSVFAIMATRVIVPFTDFIDSILVPDRLLVAGYSIQEATILFGEFFGMASTIVYVPTLMTSALCHILLTKLTSDWENNYMSTFSRKVRKAFTVTFFWGLFSSMFLFFNAKLLSSLFVNDSSLHLPIMYLCFIPLLSGLRELTTIVLWAMNLKKIPIYGLIIASILSIGINYTIIPIPKLSMVGITAGMLLYECAAIVFNLFFIRKFITFKVKIFPW